MNPSSIVRPDIPLPSHSVAIRIRAILKIDVEYVEMVNEASAEAVPLECFANANEVAKMRGGDVVYGWRIIETLPGVLMEAEFHAVWRDTNGVLHEVSPPILQGVNRTLFLADTNRIYTGKQVDNLRIALRKDRLIEKFIKCSKRWFKALNEGELAARYGDIILTSELRKIQAERELLEKEIKQKYFISSLT